MVGGRLPRCHDGPYTTTPQQVEFDAPLMLEITVATAQFDELAKSMKVTAGSQFNAAKYLEKHDRNLTRVTALTSVYIVAITILPYFWKLPTNVTDNLNLVTVVLSIIILVSALLQNSRRDAVNAEQHHRSALEINELRRELLVHGDSISNEDLLAFSSKYSAVLQKYSINHSTLDYEQFMADRPEGFPWLGFFFRFRVKIFLAVRDNAAVIVILFITAIFGWIVIFYAMPLRVSK